MNGRAPNTVKKTMEVDEKLFKGDIVYYDFKDVNRKLMVNSEGICILDSNYKWLEFYDYRSRVKLTAMYDEKNEIVQWYFDIARKVGKENGVPYEDDLYLDVVVTKYREILLLNEDELKEAYEKREMTKEEYDNAYSIAYNLIKKVKGNEEKLKDFTEIYLKIFLKGMV